MINKSNFNDDSSENEEGSEKKKVISVKKISVMKTDTKEDEPMKEDTEGIENQPFNVFKAKPMVPTSFPDLGEDFKPAKSIQNTDAMLKHYGIQLRYDIIKKAPEIIIPGFSSCSDLVLNSAQTALVNLAVINNIYSGTFERYLHTLATTRPHNSVLTWIEKIPWDGEDRLEAFYDTLTPEDHFDNELKEIMMYRFLIGAVTLLTSSVPISFRGVLTLQGKQAAGKTRWVSRLISDTTLAESVIKLDHHLDANNKDSIISATKNWLVEIGELDSTFRKDIARLKGFISNKSDRVRLPYDRRESEYQRRTAFLATVNSPNFLVDETGNTRWWTIPCKEINHSHEIEMQQLWAQVLEIVRSGEDADWWLTDEELERLESFNNQHRVLNAIVDRLQTQLDMDARPEFWSKRTATQVLQLVGIQRPTNAQCREAGAFLRENFGEPKKINGSIKWAVPPRKRSYAEDIDKPETFDNSDDF